VLVPIDLSDPAVGALAAALGWCGRLGPADAELLLPPVQLDVVHVIPRFLDCDRLSANHATIGPRLSEQVERALRGHGAEVDVREELLWGDGAAADTVRYAEQRGAGLIVLGTHGHGALKRALVGGVASAVARTAPCAVLLVPPARWSGGKAEPARAAAGALA
jgi:nucleotide-binding universal stress UspA family protein